MGNSGRLCLAGQRDPRHSQITKKCTGVADRAFPEFRVAGRNPVVLDVIWPNERHTRDTLRSCLGAIGRLHGIRIANTKDQNVKLVTDDKRRQLPVQRQR